MSRLQKLAAVFRPEAREREGRRKDRDASGSNNPALVNMVRRLVTEAANDRDNRIYNDRSITAWWDFGLRRYLGDHWDHEIREGMKRFTLNRDLVAITNNLADESITPIRPQFAPVEQDDTPVYFVSIRAGAVLMEQRVLARKSGQPDALPGVHDRKIAGMEPLSPSEVRMIRELMRPGISMSASPPEPLLDHKALVAVNDSFRAKLVQKVFDLKWQNAKGDQYVIENNLSRNIYGSAYMWAELNRQTWNIELDNPNVKNVLSDPTQYHLFRSSYVIIDEEIDLAKAIKEFPDAEQKLRQAANEGTLGTGHGEGWERGYASEQIDYQRPMVSIKVAYLRNFEVPLNEESAVQGGFVSKAEGEDGSPVVDEQGVPVYMTSDGALTTQGDDKWPTRRMDAVCKIIDDIDHVVFVRPLEYKDIPIARNINLPIPDSPHGMGESSRLKDVTDAINWAGEIMINHLIYWQYPQEFWPQSLLAKMESEGVEAFSHPAQQIGVDDADFREWIATGKFGGFVVMPPPIPTTIVNFWIEMKREHELMSAYTGVRQGLAPTSDASGELVKELVAQAGGLVAMKNTFTQFMVVHIADVMADALVRYMPASQWSQYCSDLTPEAFEYVWDGMARLQYDVVVEVGGARGNEREKDEEKAMEDLEAGLASRRTTRIRRRFSDPEGEERQIIQERRSDVTNQIAPSTGATS